MKILKIKNKILLTTIIITIISIIIGIIISAIIDDTAKKTIITNVNNTITNFINYKIQTKELINKSLSSNLIIIIIWILGISIIGIPINLALYSSKILTLTIEIIYLLKSTTINNIPFIIIYLIPKLLSAGLLFVLLYYSLNYSILIIKLISKNKEYNLNKITKKYLKILIIFIFINTLLSIFSFYVVPKIISYLI